MRTNLMIAAAFLLAASCSAPPKERQTSSALNGSVSLPGSLFEIDTDADLETGGVVKSSGTTIDWADVNEDRKTDTPSGSGDNAFGQGSKEDTPVPTVVSGSIPPNKSDLLTFGVYLEKTGSDRFLHMFWHRVQDPSGTTNMDFEFNQAKQLSGNGVTPVRTAGDLLIQYDLANGGSVPELFLSRWVDGSKGGTAADCEASNKLPCWGQKVDLTSQGDATGSINTSTIPAADSDGLGDVDPRTFGEASVDFGAIIGQGQCVSFGSAYLKSRSSDSFTAALKDFIAPTGVNISNCGSVKVIKTDDASARLSGAAFSLIRDATPTGGKPGAEDTEVVATCSADASGECLFQSVLQGAYWVVETAPPAGHDLASPAYQAASVSTDAVLTRTFVNPRHRGAIVVTKLRKHAAGGPGSHPQQGVQFTVGGITKTTGSDGKVCFDNLLLGTYVVSETVPFGYKGEASKSVTVSAKASCASPAAAAKVTFTNMPLSNITVSFSSQVPGGTAARISCKDLTASPPDPTPSLFDDVSETFKDLLPGTYTCIIVVDP